jgi:hypothetical protein
MRITEQKERQSWCPPLPAAFPAHYALRGYAEANVLRIARKYLIRRENLRRAWARIHHHLPETVQTDKPLNILEFSTAHGAMLEVWRHFGHDVRGTDFGDWPDSYGRGRLRPVFLDDLVALAHSNPCRPANPGWIYQPLIEAIGVKVDLFDAGQRPYRYRAKSVDVVCSYQAIEAYAPPEDWGEIVDEYCRIARRTVMLGFNPGPRAMRSDDAYQARYRIAIEDLRSYDRNGFRCVFLEFGETRAGFHPTALKLVAVE